MVGNFRTINWVRIKRDIEFYKIFEMFPAVVPQNKF